MEADEDGAVPRIHNGCPVVERRVLIAVTREDYVESQALKLGSDNAGERENYDLLDGIRCPRAWVRPAVRRIEHHNSEAMHGRLRFRWWGGRWRGRGGWRSLRCLLLSRLLSRWLLGWLLPSVGNHSCRKRED